MYEVSRLSQGVAAPTKGHMKARRRVMVYLNTVSDMRLHVPRAAGDTWHIYSDSDHAGDRTVGTNRSHTGIVILLNGMPIHWKSNKQPRQVPWPLVVHVDNAAGVSYQHIKVPGS